MWVYVKDSLRHRVELPPTLGLALDYWLHLHSEDVYPYWGARPLGFRSTVRAVTESNGAHDSALRRQLRHELAAFLRGDEYFGEITPPAVEIEANGSPWSDAWLKWGQAALHRADSGCTVDKLISLFAEAATKSDYRRSCYLARRLSTELSDSGWSVRQRFVRMKMALCDSGAFKGVEVDAEGIRSVILSVFKRPSPRIHNVTVSFAPVTVPQSFPGRFALLPGLPVFLTEPVDEATIKIVGASKSLLATDPETAQREAHYGFRQLIDILRVRHYVRTTLCGSVRVDVEGESKPTWLPLPQPFWRRQGARRPIPRVPANFNGFVDSELPEPEREAWHAARWHLSQSFADWPEDPHEAAAKCWQAIESFFPGSQKAMFRVTRSIPAYLSVATAQALVLLATRVNSQAFALKQLDPSSNWYRWNSRQLPVEKWIGRVSDRRSDRHWSTWKNPPLFLFDTECGLITVLRRFGHLPGTQKWLSLRLESDLTLLYGLRNKVVHTGERYFPAEVATYLAKTAAEFVLTLMDARHREIRGIEDLVPGADVEGADVEEADLTTP